MTHISTWTCRCFTCFWHTIKMIVMMF